MKKKQVFRSSSEALAALVRFTGKFRVYKVYNDVHDDLWVVALSPRDALGQVAELFGLSVELISPRPVKDPEGLAEFAASLPPAKRSALLAALKQELV